MRSGSQSAYARIHVGGAETDVALDVAARATKLRPLRSAEKSSPRRARSVNRGWQPCRTQNTHMNGSPQSILLGTAALGAAGVVALVLTIIRRTEQSDPRVRERLVRLLLVGIVLQCAHFTEEFITAF